VKTTKTKKTNNQKLKAEIEALREKLTCAQTELDASVAESSATGTALGLAQARLRTQVVVVDDLRRRLAAASKATLHNATVGVRHQSQRDDARDMALRKSDQLDCAETLVARMKESLLRERASLVASLLSCDQRLSLVGYDPPVNSFDLVGHDVEEAGGNVIAVQASFDHADHVGAIPPPADPEVQKTHSPLTLKLSLADRESRVGAPADVCSFDDTAKAPF